MTSRTRTKLIYELSGVESHSYPCKDWSKCQRCKEVIPTRRLILHHRFDNGNEDRQIGNASMYRRYMDNLKEAKKQLQVLCKNCHGIIHAELRESKLK